MFKKNLSIFLSIPLILIFLYYASYFNNPLNSSQKKIEGPVFKSQVSGKNGMVVSASKYVSQVGIDILENGGNAVDAAVAMGFALAVTYPQAGNIGGGGFMVIRTKDNLITSIDYREKAPIASTRDMFLDAGGNFLPEKSQVGHLSAGVPGSVAGMLFALEKYGTMKREDVLTPAVKLAEDGFEIEDRFAESLNSNFNNFSRFPSTKKVFTKSGLNYNAGELFIQKDLANTLKLISIHGRDGFYSGIVAELIEKEMQQAGGIITKQDLLDYNPVERKPVSTNYKGYEIYSMAPPSSGGIALIQLLNMIENEQIPNRNSAYYGAEEFSAYIHVMTESMKRVYADRSEFLGDPDFWKVPVNGLINEKYSQERRKEIKETATPSGEIKPGSVQVYESDQTTHYSVIDKDGNMVSVTTTLNNTYGSYVVVDGAGFLLNDEMDDFASKPGEPNMFGLVGNEANAIQPGKRMLSSMTPTIILKDGNPFMVVGSPGGGKIITSVFRVIVNVIDFSMALDSAIDLPRFHHQWLPEYIQYESGAFDDEVLTKLREKGHELKQVSDFGRVEGILIDWKNHMYYGHSDRRGYGKALGY
jgi:gamma-glutamyltranspeptidase / glutathione hydrolase